MFHQIQERIETLVKDRKIIPVVVCDEAQYYKSGVLNDLKMLMNFEMDTKDYAVLILVGQPVLNDILSRNINEALNQRIIINYTFMGIEPQEVKDYIIDRCRVAGISNEIFDENAIKALASNCNGSTRSLNNLIDKSLMICMKQKANIISTETIMLAATDISLI